MLLVKLDRRISHEILTLEVSRVLILFVKIVINLGLGKRQALLECFALVVVLYCKVTVLLFFDVFNRKWSPESGTFASILSFV